MKNLFRKIITHCLIIITFAPAIIFAGTSGKISGIVRDAETNEPLPGCNIIIEGTYLGAASNIDGDFFILNIPPGTYTVRATMIGYKPYRINKHQIRLLTNMYPSNTITIPLVYPLFTDYIDIFSFCKCSTTK